MPTKDDLKERLKQKSSESSKRADALLADELDALKQATNTDLEALRPKVTDKAAYDQLIAVVEEASRKNMSLAMLEQKLKSLGSSVVSVAKEVATLLKA